MADISSISPSPYNSTSSALAKAKVANGSGSTILGSGASILTAGGSLLEAGRRINRSGIGMSASSRQLLEGFYNNASAIFNQLYTKAENGEATNIMQIKALRSKYDYLVRDDLIDNGAAAKSTTSGTQVDTDA